MGQSVVSLMYGISNETPGLHTEDGEYFWEDTAPEKRLKWGDDRYPNSAYEGGVIGFPVASGPAYDDNEGNLGDTTLVSEIEKAHEHHLKEAKKRWAAFASWVQQTHGKKLPKPQLWITTDERA